MNISLGRVPALLLLSLALLVPGFAQEDPLYFIQMSDTQFGMYSGDQGFAQETANYQFAIAAANRLRPAFVVITGDLVNRPGDAAQVEEYLRISRQADPRIPLYHVAGNHDAGNEPTPQSLAAYREKFGRDYYSFRAGSLYGIVLNSALLHSPKGALADLDQQEIWLRKELEAAGVSGARHVVVFQHHPYFVTDTDEPDAYHNIPLERRLKYLDLLYSRGVRFVFAGHYHQNALAKYRELEVVTTGPVGKPLGGSRSGMRIVSATAAGLVHRYFDFGDLPFRLADIQNPR